MNDQTNETSQLDDLLRRGMRTAVDHEPQAAKIWDALRELIEKERSVPPPTQIRASDNATFARCSLSPCMQFAT